MLALDIQEKTKNAPILVDYVTIFGIQVPKYLLPVKPPGDGCCGICMPPREESRSQSFNR